jgi:hypothetical protein
MRLSRLTLMMFFFILPFTRLGAVNDFCGLNNSAFSAGEVITFKIFYNVIGLYVDAGTASFTIAQEKLNNRPVYHVTGLGTSNPSYDWIFRVRDRYETFIDTATLKPYKFIRHVEEGGFRKL